MLRENPIPANRAIHDVDEESGQAFIVMQFLESQTLKHRIAGKPLLLDDVLDLAIQIADALDEKNCLCEGDEVIAVL